MQKDGGVLIRPEKPRRLSRHRGHPGGSLAGGHPQLTAAARRVSCLLPAPRRGTGRVVGRRGYLACHAGENPLPPHTSLVQGCAQPATGSPGTPQAGAVGRSES